MRLIDADAINLMSCPLSIIDMPKWIDEQPTAYDIGNVVEQLEENYSYDVGNLKMISVDKAIEIVKGGEQNDI